jgi:predicted AlkP superfamily pyrophosphatase or phosphodiesterase
MPRLFVLLLAFALTACASGPRPAADAATRPLVVLISIDGFRPDYLERGQTPVLRALAAEGAQAAMTPSFPTVTFPNHYTLVTGRHPDHHGVVGNAFEDAALGRFSMAKTEPGWWRQAEPIWITAEKAGLTAATMFWPGSETPHDGVMPRYWARFDQTLSGDGRVDRLLGWLDQTPRPDLATLYFDIVDSAGHQNGPDAPETTAAAASVDASIGRLIDGLKARGLYERTVLVIVSDHGMAATAPERSVRLGDLVDPAAIDVIYGGAVVYLNPRPGREAEVRQALVGRHAHGECWDRASIPARFVLGSNPRVPSIVCLADTGWLLTPPGRDSIRPGGAHGYDNAALEMRALFIAHGPGIARGVRLEAMDSVDVQPMLGRLMGVETPPGDGRLEDTAAAFQP